MPRTFRHISKLKDIKDVNATENYNPKSPFPLICPFSRLEYSGLSRFVFLWKCGCMMSEKVLLANKKKEDETRNCPSCGEEYDQKDVIPLNLTPEEIDERRETLKKETEKPSGILKDKQKAENLIGSSIKLQDEREEDATLGKREINEMDAYLLTEPTEKPVKSSKPNILDKLANEKPDSKQQKGRAF